MQSLEELGEAEAAAAIAAVREELRRRNKAAVIAVADAHGELISLLKTDGAPYPSILIATNKAWTAVRERTNSGEVGRKSRESNWQLQNFGDLRYTGFNGGAPVWVQGKVVGAVAVSGLSEEEDIELAEIGVATILKRIG